MKTTDLNQKREIFKPKLRFDISGYYFIGLLVLAILGFWPSYFAKFFDGTANLSFYYHFHAAMMTLWISMLILQPLLIWKKKLALHRFVGKLSYLLFPLMLISITLVIHQGHHFINEKDVDISLFNQFRASIIFTIAYFIAILYRHDIHIHARAMVATGIAMIEAALTRLVYNSFGAFKELAASPYYFSFATLFSISLIFLLVIGLMIKERKQKRDRWVFPFIFGLYLITYLIGFFHIHIGLEPLAKWFTSLPLT